jgi:ABC-type branched-subunit amino acid transport system substrate-binding protein
MPSPFRPGRSSTDSRQHRKRRWSRPAPNFFRFSTDGAQWQAGLGTFAYDTKGYRNVAVVAGDYSFGYTQVLGFMTEFCAKGGKVIEKIWVPNGTKDFSSSIARIPAKADAVYVMLGGADAVNFLTQYDQSGAKQPLIAGSNVVDQTVLSSKGPFQRRLVGTRQPTWWPTRSTPRPTVTTLPSTRSASRTPVVALGPVLRLLRRHESRTCSTEPGER